MAEKIVPVDINLVRYSDPEEKLQSDELDGNDGRISDEKSEDILNTIFPPREWEENGKLWRQEVSKEPAPRLEVMKFTRMFDTTLKQFKARETGICPTRQALYSQCFDEIIRQVTVDCTDTGLLLMKVRDELKMSTDAYKTVYEGSISLALRKPQEFKLSDMQNQLTELKAKEQKIKDDLKKAIEKYEMIQSQETRDQIVIQRKFSEKMNSFNNRIQQMSLMLENLPKS